ncbi:putative bifunctional diguanylate cyclase/phosphodiesterase [Kineobactrum salinum]|uniref:cyclic-guanylate-specific phosphodiesterase n=1 Tax=Kineobactrum salinum TaxID=2708301 RepID=A0A6C0U544_9GAMM|nr:bifunctional diguanylate cyclase/phosphodiesterase [Kineobactrum salinum]QIB64564.1 GGDEF domain-containing protein [Kineobactrum salinum]
MIKDIGIIKRLQWRGVRQADEKAASESDQAGRGRVVVLLGGGNQALLTKQLQPHCEIVQPRESRLVRGSFDMAIVDIEGLKQWKDQLLDEKIREEPTFLPIVLVLSDRELRFRLKTFWDTIDEFIITPIQPREFSERIAMLLRTRRLALAQRENLAYLVNHDRITGLPNKNLFLEHLADRIRDASILQKHLHAAVVHISMSQVMRSLGHYGLERAASQCSTRLVALLKNELYIARLTTEEWGLIARPGADLTNFVELCGRLQHLGAEPIVANGERVHLSPRIGVGIYPADGSDAHSLLNCATAALSNARSTAPVFYSSDVQHEALRFIRTQTRLYEALEKRQFELWYQPQLSFATGQVVGVEALVRWRLPGGQLVPPIEFIPVAEATGQIVDIDRWVLDTACATMRGWQERKFAVSRISVNVTVADVETPDFVELVQNALSKHGLLPSNLELELTESALLETGPANLDKLHQLRTCGIRIAVDDFGTGYSSLGYLHKLPVTTLKIDKTFVDHVVRSPTDAAIAETIIWLARKFKLETVAEGVENQAQADVLKARGVDIAQGFFYARPMPERELREWVEVHQNKVSD